MALRVAYGAASHDVRTDGDERSERGPVSRTLAVPNRLTETTGSSGKLSEQNLKAPPVMMGGAFQVGSGDQPASAILARRR